MQPPVRMIELDEGPPPPGEPIPMLAFVNAILRNRIRILSLAMGLAFIVGVYTLMQPRQYVSNAAFSLQASESRRMSGLAAQFGLAVPSSDGAQSTDYYLELLASREILGKAVATTYSYTDGGKVVKGTLTDLYDVRESDPGRKTDAAIRALRGAITKEQSRETGIVKVGVSARSPFLAQQIVTRLLELLNEFNLKTRQSQAANERRFIEQRLTEIGADLRAAEDRLQSFLQRNRGNFASIPELSLEHERLTREVALHEQVYNSLAQSYEQARIDEVRDTPALTVIESPNLPVRPATRGVVRKVFVAGMVGLLIGILPLLMRVLLVTQRRSVEEEVAEYRKLRGEMRLWRHRSQRPPLTAREA